MFGSSSAAFPCSVSGAHQLFDTDVGVASGISAHFVTVLVPHSSFVLMCTRGNSRHERLECMGSSLCIPQVLAVTGMLGVNQWIWELSVFLLPSLHLK